MFIPTMFDVARLTWTTEQGGHAPIIVATGGWAPVARVQGSGGRARPGQRFSRSASVWRLPRPLCGREDYRHPRARRPGDVRRRSSRHSICWSAARCSGLCGFRSCISRSRCRRRITVVSIAHPAAQDRHLAVRRLASPPARLPDRQLRRDDPNRQLPTAGCRRLRGSELDHQPCRRSVCSTSISGIDPIGWRSSLVAALIVPVAIFSNFMRVVDAHPHHLLFRRSCGARASFTTSPG